MTSFLRQRRAASLAAAVVICLGVAPNTQSGATNTIVAKSIADEHMPVMPASTILHENGEVLSQNDVGLYRSAFAAQAKGDWASADQLMNTISDRRLAGYVLADRYQRRTATLPELQVWLAAYRDLPMAEDFYYQAAKLPGAKKIKLAHPAASHDMGRRRLRL